MKTSDYRGILYNFANEYWQKNADLIPGINYAIDRQGDCRRSTGWGMGEVAYGPLQRNIYNYEDVEDYEYDPEKAARVFEAAGCTKDADGYWCRDGERIGFTINASSTDQCVSICTDRGTAATGSGTGCKSKCPAEGIDWGGQECCIIGWGSPFDADDHTYKVFGTDKGANYSGYSNPLVDEYLTKARETDDPSERAEYYAQFQNELAKTPAYTFFCYIDAMYVVNNHIKGISSDTVLGHHGVGIFWNVCDWTIE